MAGKLDNALRFHQEALNLRAYRQQLLASNIANADTPGYKAKDIDFAATLQGALANHPGRPSLVATAPGHIRPGNGQPPEAAVQYRTAQQPSLDGNTVEMDVERAQFADNAIRYEAGLTFISSQVKTMLLAIQGQ